MESTAKLPVIGLDIAKNVFQLHIVDADTGEIQRRQLKRAKVAEFFANRQPSLVAIEACGGAHHWARTLLAMGHQVKLLPARHVKAFLLCDKTDALDAQAIWVAAQQPHIKAVSIKSEQQQALSDPAQHAPPAHEMRIMQTNALRGLLYEFGIVLPVGHNKLLQSIQGELAHAQQHSRLPGIVVVSVQEQLKRIDAMQDDIDELSRRLGAMLKHNQQMLLIAGARAIVGRSEHSSWIERLLQRRHFNVVVAAVANTMARTVWAVLVKGVAFDQIKWNPTQTAVA